MKRHTCHLPGCVKACPPRHLLCREHWFMVPQRMQERVNDTIWGRRATVDSSWAPWWRAKTEAIASVLRHIGWGDEAKIVKFEVRGETVAGMLEGSEE
jgi:hypothetical protein